MSLLWDHWKSCHQNYTFADEKWQLTPLIKEIPATSIKKKKNKEKRKNESLKFGIKAWSM